MTAHRAHRVRRAPDTRADTTLPLPLLTALTASGADDGCVGQDAALAAFRAAQAHRSAMRARPAWQFMVIAAAVIILCAVVVAAAIPQWGEIENAYKTRFGNILDSAAGHGKAYSSDNVMQALSRATA